MDDEGAQTPTLRDQFALAALTEFTKQYPVQTLLGDGYYERERRAMIAVAAYEMADAMLQER